MPGAGVVWNILRTAATKVPWGRVVQNAPMVVDLVERVRERMGVVSHQNFDELRLLREQHVKLADGLLQASNQLEELTKTVEVMAARQKLMAIATVVSFLAAISALALWATK